MASVSHSCISLNQLIFHPFLPLKVPQTDLNCVLEKGFEFMDVITLTTQKMPLTVVLAMYTIKTHLDAVFRNFF